MRGKLGTFGTCHETAASIKRETLVHIQQNVFGGATDPMLLKYASDGELHTVADIVVKAGDERVKFLILDLTNLDRLKYKPAQPTQPQSNKSSEPDLKRQKSVFGIGFSRFGMDVDTDVKGPLSEADKDAVKAAFEHGGKQFIYLAEWILGAQAKFHNAEAFCILTDRKCDAVQGMIECRGFLKVTPQKKFSIFFFDFNEPAVDLF